MSDSMTMDEIMKAMADMDIEVVEAKIVECGLPCDKPEFQEGFVEPPVAEDWKCTDMGWDEACAEQQDIADEKRRLFMEEGQLEMESCMEDLERVYEGELRLDKQCKDERVENLYEPHCDSSDEAETTACEDKCKNCPYYKECSESPGFLTTGNQAYEGCTELPEYDDIPF